MATTVRQFLESLSRHHIVEAERTDEVRRIAAKFKAEADASELAKAMVGAGAMTKLQAAAAYQGKLSELVLGNYVLLEKLGEGGMGQVYRARHLKMDRIVAIKVLPRRLLSSPDAVQRFQREARAAAKLVHQNIVTAFDADEANGQHFLVMEFIDGRDLAQIVRADGPLPISKAVKALLEAAHGLKHAHAQGVVHRDIKPSNLLVDPSGTVKILDMGLARFDGDANAPVTGPGSSTRPGDDLTQNGSVMGTIDYMAPEQAMDTRAADARADVYSLGCTLHFLLVGRPPFQGDTLMKRLVAHRDSPIPSLKQARRDVSDELEALYKRLMAKQPGDRPKADEVIRAVEKLPKSAGQRAQRSRTPVVAGFAVGGVALVGLIVALVMVLGKEKQPLATNTPAPATDATATTTLLRPATTVTAQPPQVAPTASAVTEAVTTPPIDPKKKPKPTKEELTAAVDYFASKAPPGVTVNSPPPFTPAAPAATATATVASPFSTATPTAPTTMPSAPTATPSPTLVASVTPATVPFVPAATAPVFTTPAAPTSVEKLPVPDAAERQATATKLREIYVDSLKAATDDRLRAELVEKLLVDAGIPSEAPTTKYGLYELARSVAIDAADPMLLRKATTAACALFEESEAAAHAAALTAAVPQLRDVAVAKRFAEDALKRIDEALDEDDFAAVDKLLPVVTLLQSKTRDAEINRDLNDRRARLIAQRKELEAAEKAAETLSEKPDDPIANLVRGRFVCFTRGDWKTGLPLLAKGSDEALKRLALQIADPAAATSAEQLTAGNVWWTESQKQKANATRYRDLLKGTNFWYRSCYATLAEIDRKLLDGRLAEIEKTVGPLTVAAAGGAFEPNKLPPQLVFQLAPGIDFELVLVPAGKFVLGSPQSELKRSSSEVQHEVTISRPFYMAKFETFHDLWVNVTGLPKPLTSVGPRAPVGRITWLEAVDAARKLNERLAGQAPLAGYEFRLPTEAEWEYACRAGTTTVTHYGDIITPREANIGGGMGSQFKPVGSYKPNAWGLYDMHGNMSEWVLDWYDYFSAVAAVDPTGPKEGRERIVRGSAAQTGIVDIRSARRKPLIPHALDGTVGCRFVYAPVLTAAATPGAAFPIIPTTSSTSPAAAPSQASTAGLTPELEFAIGPGVSLQLVAVPAGKFLMGSPPQEPNRSTDEVQHEVTISRPFYLGKFELQHRQYTALVGPRKPLSAGPSGPAFKMNWADADDYCRRLNEQLAGKTPLDGYVFRLPTEAEWEYACRAGTTTATHFGPALTENDAHVGGGKGAPLKVTGSYPPNAWGLYDMHGNTSEWVWDWYGPYPTGAVVDPTGPASGTIRCVRGRAAFSPLTEVRSAARWGIDPGKIDVYRGFRIAYGPALNP